MEKKNENNVWNNNEMMSGVLLENRIFGNKIFDLKKEEAEKLYPVIRKIGKYRYFNSLCNDPNYYFISYLRSISDFSSFAKIVSNEVAMDEKWMSERKMNPSTFYEKYSNILRLYVTILFEPLLKNTFKEKKMNTIFSIGGISVRVIENVGISIYMDNCCVVFREKDNSWWSNTIDELLVHDLPSVFGKFMYAYSNYQAACSNLYQTQLSNPKLPIAQFKSIKFKLNVKKYTYLYVCLGIFTYREKVYSVALSDLVHPLLARSRSVEEIDRIISVLKSNKNDFSKEYDDAFTAEDKSNYDGVRLLSQHNRSLQIHHIESQVFTSEKKIIYLSIKYFLHESVIYCFTSTHNVSIQLANATTASKLDEKCMLLAHAIDFPPFK